MVLGPRDGSTAVVTDPEGTGEWRPAEQQTIIS